MLSVGKKWLFCFSRKVGLCVGQNQMCHLCGWLKLFLKNVWWKKIKIQKRWLLGRLSDGSFVQSLYVYFCRSFLLCRLLGLHITCIYPKQTCTNPSKFSAFAKVCYVYFLTQIYTLFLKNVSRVISPTPRRKRKALRT